MRGGAWFLRETVDGSIIVEAKAAHCVLSVLQRHRAEVSILSFGVCHALLRVPYRK